MKTRAHWAIEPNGSAVVFVHGFGGGAVKSWSNFPGLAPARPQFAGVDLIFYGYDSFKDTLHPVAADVRELLAKLFANPAREIINDTLDPRLGRPESFRYKRVVVAAHSTGAVISRLAILEATQAGAPWATNIRLVCFAPAHHGVRVTQLVGECFTVLKVPLVGKVVSLFMKTLDDLKEGSQFIESLKKETDAAISAGAAQLIAKAVVFARKDIVVDTVRFCRDPPPVFMENKNHVNICQPGPDYVHPLEWVSAAIP